MGRARRFVLVATVVTGIMMWASIPFGQPHGRWYPLVGLAAAIASAASAWAPRFATHALVRILLAGCIAWGVLGFLALAFRDLTGMGFDMHGTLVVLVIGWLVASGVVGRLVIVDSTAKDIYFGVVIAFASATPFIPTRHHDGVGGRIVGMCVLALLPMFCAAVTGALHRRFTKPAAAEVPDARVIS